MLTGLRKFFRPLPGILAAIFFLSGSYRIQAQALSKIDKSFFLEVQSWRSDRSDVFFKIYSGSVLPVAFLIPAGIYGASASGLKNDSSALSAALKTTAAAGTGFLLSWGLKKLIQRPRPYDALPDVNPVLPLPDSRSMPSGHTSVAFSSAVALCLEYPRWEVITPSLLWAGGVGFSRVMLGHHYPGDVLAGAALGSACAWLGWHAHKKLNARHCRRSGWKK